MLQIEGELSKAGDNGRYQQLLLWLVILPAQLPFGTHQYFQYLGSWTPDNWCKVSRVTQEEPALYWNLRVAMVKQYRSTAYLHSQCFINHTLNSGVISGFRKEAHKRMKHHVGNVTSSCLSGWYYNRSWLEDSNTIVTEVRN